MEIGAYSCKKATPAGSPCCGWCGDMEGCPSSIPRVDKERRDALVKALAKTIRSSGVNADIVDTISATVDAEPMTAEMQKEVDVKLMTEAIARHMQRMQNFMRVEILPNDREKNGWLEWLVIYEYWTGGKLTVGFIQRRPGERVETHT